MHTITRDPSHIILGNDYAYRTSGPVANTCSVTVNKLVQLFNSLTRATGTTGAIAPKVLVKPPFHTCWGSFRNSCTFKMATGFSSDSKALNTGFSLRWC